ncbi:hypothetical protein GGX14DRAFT_619591 [Mycena pura]|uniref:RING-CH-type domain-containing protein n=1 Tax=Mycena pura TaxID=153505 RepID=A0AAD6VIC3_9AGAR|nr:hypothetical protein GGX14DRAFT_619591 [Mycena pura]
MNSGSNHIPTLDDLRVKACFICLEEEIAPRALPETPAPATLWVHPCPNCALLAHDRCLLRWISSLPVKRRSERAGAHTIFVLDTFRCPRCRRAYELADPLSPRLHQVILVSNALYRLFSGLVDVACTAAGLVTLEVIPLSVSFQSRMVVLSAMLTYELAFLRTYLGPTMFRLLLPAKLSDLVRSLFITVPTIPFRLLLPGTVPQWIIPLYFALPPILYGMTELGTLTPPDSLPLAKATPTSESRAPIALWPPSPALLGLVLVPRVISPLYTSLFSRFRAWVLGAPPPTRQKRYLTERVRSVFTYRTRRARAAAAAAAAPAAAAPDLAGDPAPLVLADQIVQKDQTSLTHDVVHALATLVLPRLFGDALRAAALAARSVHLRRVLGLRAVPALAPAGPLRAYCRPRQLGGMLLGGSWVWAEVDPVWWRNSLGYGVYVLAKDCFELYRLWLQKEEVQSRTIKSRDFAGVDASQLELIAPEKFLHAAM